MKIDTYSKVILTGIAIFLGFIAFDYKPSINAHAALHSVQQKLASSTEQDGGVWWLRDDKIKLCYNPLTKGFKPTVTCTGWVRWSDPAYN